MTKAKKVKAFWRQLGFQLNQNDPEDFNRIGILDWLAAAKKKNTVLRDGLDIVYALRYLNDATPLLRFFPNIVELISRHSDPLLQAIFDQQQEILRRLNELESKGISTQPITGSGLKPMKVPEIPMPDFSSDDDEPIKLVVKADPNAAATIVANFLASAQSVQ